MDGTCPLMPPENMEFLCWGMEYDIYGNSNRSPTKNGLNNGVQFHDDKPFERSCQMLQVFSLEIPFCLMVFLLLIQDALELELKAETMLTRVLREKLCCKDLELDQLQAELASSIRVLDVLQSEIQRLQDQLSCLTHKMKDMELQVWHCLLIYLPLVLSC